MKTSVIKFLSVILFATATSIQAGALTVPSTFDAGTPAVAAEVNGNFTAVKSAVDDNDSRITALETAPAAGLDALSCSAGQITQWDGGAWTCSTPVIDTNTDALSSLSCSAGQVAQWNGTVWVCAALPDTLASLSCATDEVVKWDGAAWVCSSNASGQRTEVQVETATQLVAALAAITDNSASKPYVIRLLPGVYDIFGVAAFIDMKPWVSIIGAGQKSTIIKSASAAHVIEGADDAELRSLSIINLGTGSNGGAGISCNNVGGSAPCTSANSFLVKDVQVTTTGGSSSGSYGIYINDAALTVIDSNILVTGNSGQNIGVYTLNTTTVNILRTDVVTSGNAQDNAGLLLQGVSNINLRDSTIKAFGGNYARGIMTWNGSHTLHAYNTDFSADGGSSGTDAIRWQVNGNAHIERSSLNAVGATGRAVSVAGGTVNLVNSYLWGQLNAFARTGGTLLLYDTYPNGGTGTGGATCVGINFATGARTSVACQ